MKLYALSQRKITGHDYYDSAVVSAPDEESARNMHPKDGLALDAMHHQYIITWPQNPDHVGCQYIGQAMSGMGQIVICASFNAG